MSCANPPPSPGSMRDPTSPRPGEVKIGGTTVRGEAARIGRIALADRQDVRPSLALRPTTGWMARTTRARPGLSEAPDLLALIELARASAAAIGPAQPGSLLSRSMPPDPVQLDATLSGPTFGGPVMSTLALASSGLASPAVTSPALASQARAKLARANPASEITSARESINAATVPDVRRGAASKLSAAKRPSTGRIHANNGVSTRVTAMAIAGASKIAAKPASRNPA